MSVILEILLRSIITAVVAVPLGFYIYHLIYYKITNREKIKRLVLEYLEFANLNYDTSESTRIRTIFDDEFNVQTVDSCPVYPSTKAVMNWVNHNYELQRGIKFGFKYDEYFGTILSELIMEGRVSAIHDKDTDEMIGFKFEHFDM